MSLDQTELKIVQNTGSDTEKGYATVGTHFITITFIPSSGDHANPSDG